MAQISIILCNILTPFMLETITNSTGLSWYYPVEQHSIRIIYVIVLNPSDTAHYNDVIMGAMASHQRLDCLLKSLFRSIYKRHHQSSASLGFVRRIHRWPVNTPYNGPVTRRTFPFDDIIIPWNSLLNSLQVDDHLYLRIAWQHSL